MIKEAINRILSLASPTLNKIDGQTYSDRALHLITPPLPEPLIIHTLTGLMDYININLDQDLCDLHFFLHVVNPREVEVMSGLNPSAKRHFFAAARVNNETFSFGRWLDLETIIIRLQAYFVQDQNSQRLLRLLSNIKSEIVKISQDDGISQSVTVKTGPALVQETVVPNPVILRPYRTFVEIEQPASPFVFRLNTEGLGGALFEADGGIWQLEAIGKIRNFLRENLPNEVQVIA